MDTNATMTVYLYRTTTDWSARFAGPAAVLGSQICAPVGSARAGHVGVQPVDDQMCVAQQAMLRGLDLGCDQSHEY